MKTIFAPATAPGRAGIAMVRVSGPESLSSLRALTGAALPPPRRAVLRALMHPGTGVVIDRAVVIRFAAPASFTGEDVIEYHLHGGPAVVRMMMDSLAGQSDHCLAQPGEFTRRAFENGKMDLTGAEAIADLINAETELQHQQALSQMEGSLTVLYEGWRHDLSRALAHLEADIDFPDEDLPEGVAVRIVPVLEALRGKIAAHLDDNRRGERLRDGIRIAVVGAPNAGKSSLVNALARRDVAIVSDQAGTTRDVIEVHLDLGGYPVILADTAGLRPGQLQPDGQGAIESEGIRRALDRARQADLTLLLFDSNAAPDAATLALRDNRKSLVVLNKSDLGRGHDAPPEALEISVKTGHGIDKLLQALLHKIEDIIGNRSAPSLTRQRHREALHDCLSSLDRALSAGESELMAEDARLAMRALGRITGRVDVEDLLDIIFRDFCIGK
ncbi:MAG TPA: tRNA uridine-5-carboxymethylaminomethyl(34) synthesis GTPase MnmE [Micavibrio sp.]|jgi:tRNA modification GTPase